MRIVFKIFMNFLTKPVKMFRTLKQLNRWICSDKMSPVSPAVSGRNAWDGKCREIIITSIRSPVFHEYLQIIEAFYNDPIVCIRDFTQSVLDEEIILLVPVKNDCSRIERLTRHYKGIGIKNIVFVDNGSNDGTVEIVLEQDNVACYQTLAKFNSFRKAGWLSRIAAHYGTDRWYIIIDSDELLVYPAMTQLSIQQYVELAQKKGYSCIKTVMLDVYPDGPLMDDTKSDNEYMDCCIYFDRGDKPERDGKSVYNISGNVVSGGMRTRLFFEDAGVVLTRATMLRFTKAFLTGPHGVYPKMLNETCPHAGALLHYKFLPSDTMKYQVIVQEGTYYNESAMYKTINSKMKQVPAINAMSELSVEFNKDGAWQYLPFIKTLQGV